MKNFLNYFKLFQPLYFVLFAAILIAGTFFLDIPSLLQLLMVFVIVMAFTLGNAAFGKWLTHDAKGRKALQNQQFALAAEEFRKGLDCTRNFADDDPRVAQLLDGFAQAQKGLGDYTEAESLSQQALAVQEKAWGPDHYRTMACVVNLGNVYLDLARYDEAKALYERALNIVEERRGDNHRDVAICLNNMGKVYSDRERYAEAEPFFRRAMEIMEARCKPTHWYVGFLCNNMAYVLGRGGKLGEAETFAERAVAIFEKSGKRDLMLAGAYGNLGHIRYRQGRLAEAEDLLQQSYTIQKKLLTRAHPHLATTLHDLARVFMAQQRWQEAEEVCQREVHLCEEYLVPTHPSLARALENYADLLAQQARDMESENLRTKAQQVRACFETTPKTASASSGLDTAIRPPPVN